MRDACPRALCGRRRRSDRAAHRPTPRASRCDGFPLPSTRVPLTSCAPARRFGTGKEARVRRERRGARELRRCAAGRFTAATALRGTTRAVLSRRARAKWGRAPLAPPPRVRGRGGVTELNLKARGQFVSTGFELRGRPLCDVRFRARAPACARARASQSPRASLASAPTRPPAPLASPSAMAKKKSAAKPKKAAKKNRTRGDKVPQSPVIKSPNRQCATGSEEEQDARG